MTAEQELVVLLARIEPSPLDIDRVRELLDGRVRWTELTGQLFFQRVAGLAWVNLVRFGLARKVHRELHQALHFTYEAQRRWHSSFSACVREVTSVFNEAALQYAFLKGTLLSQIIYPPGTRTSNDSDVLVAPGSLSTCGDALESIGYVQGRYDRSQNRVVPATRKEKLFARMSQYELVPFVRLIEDPFLRMHEVDVNFSLVLNPAGTKGPDIDLLLSEPALFEVDGLRARTLPNELFLIQLCTHFFKEASNLVWIKSVRDLGLYKLVDVHEFVRKTGPSIDWDQLVTVSHEYQLSAQVYYALHFATEIFGQFIPDAAMAALRPGDTSYLEEYGDGTETGVRFRWDRPFSVRLFDETRAEESDEEQLGAFDEYRLISSQIRGPADE